MNKYNNRTRSKHYKGRVWVTTGGMDCANICVELASGEFRVIGFKPEIDINDETITACIKSMGWKPSEWL